VGQASAAKGAAPVADIAETEADVVSEVEDHRPVGVLHTHVVRTVGDLVWQRGKRTVPTLIQKHTTQFYIKTIACNCFAEEFTMPSVNQNQVPIENLDGNNNQSNGSIIDAPALFSDGNATFNLAQSLRFGSANLHDVLIEESPPRGFGSKDGLAGPKEFEHMPKEDEADEIDKEDEADEIDKEDEADEIDKEDEVDEIDREDEANEIDKEDEEKDPNKDKDEESESGPSCPANFDEQVRSYPQLNLHGLCPGVMPSGS